MLTPLNTCLAQALDGLTPVPPVLVDAHAAEGHVLAEDVSLSQDMPQDIQALRAGFAVAALDLVGASLGSPVPLTDPSRVQPGDTLPPATDAVLPDEGVEQVAGVFDAIRPVGPGEGARRAGHDGRAGTVLLRAGTRISPRDVFCAALAGIDQVWLRRPRVALMLPDPAQSAFLRTWLAGLGADVIADGPADLTLRSTTTHVPRLALAPAETAWLARDDTGLVLDLPIRFDGLFSACLGLALPVLAHLSGARLREQSRPLARKLSSSVGLSELVLLDRVGDDWHPQPTGLVTLSSLVHAQAFAILPPSSEGLQTASLLSATPLDLPFE